MLNVHNETFDGLKKYINKQRSDVLVMGAYNSSPSQFPCVSFVETVNIVYQPGRILNKLENFTVIGDTIEVFSDKVQGKQEEVREIAMIADEYMSSLGYTRTFNDYIPNFQDRNIARFVLQYRAKINNKTMVVSRP